MKKYISTIAFLIFSCFTPLLAQNWGLKVVNLNGNQDLIYVPQHDRLYVASGSKVFRLNPYLGRLEDSITFSEKVGKIVVSDDAHYLYAIIGDRTKIVRFNLITRQLERTIQMGNSQFGGVLLAGEMAVMPQHPLTLAVFRDGNPVNIAIFDDAIRRPHTTQDEFFVLNAHSMIFAGSDSTTLFAVPNGSSSDAFYKIKIKSDGAYAIQQADDLTNGFRKKIIWGADGFIYGSSGTRIDVKTLKPRRDGIYRMSSNQDGEHGQFMPDPLNNNIYGINTSGIFVQLTTFNKTTFNQTSQAKIPIQVNSSIKLVDWGSGKLAFINGLQIVILQQCISRITTIPTIEQGIKLQACADSSVVLSATSGAPHYFWSTGDTGRIIRIKQQYRSQTPLTISVAAADSDGCPTAFSTPIRLDFQDDAAPYISVEDSRTIVCQNDSIRLSVSQHPNQHVEWTNGATGAVLYAKQGGSYSARFLSPIGCRTVWSNPVVLTGSTFNVPPRPNVTITPADTSICVNQTITFSAPANYQRYQWSDGSTTQTTSWQPFSGDIRSFFVRVIDVNGCTSPPSVPVTITAFYLPQRPFISVNGNILASSSPEGNQWFLNGNPIAGANTPFFTVTTSGTYTLQVKIGGCVSDLSTPIQF